MAEDAPAVPMLEADCSRCFALCCVAPAFVASTDFGFSKPAGRPCRNLQADFRCGIHSSLRVQGFPGCTVYDCFGAGQHVSQGTFAGNDWRSTDPQQMFDVFAVMRQLHELLWYVEAALSYGAAAPVHHELRSAREVTVRMTESPAADLAGLDVGSHREAVNVLLVMASELVRAPFGKRARQLRGADLVGAKLAGADLRGASLRGALLVGAELGGADLRSADLIGADLRGADLRRADLRDTLFLTKIQLDSAVGDPLTRLPSTLRPPRHWS